MLDATQMVWDWGGDNVSRRTLSHLVKKKVVRQFVPGPNAWSANELINPQPALQATLVFTVIFVFCIPELCKNNKGYHDNEFLIWQIISLIFYSLMFVNWVHCYLPFSFVFFFYKILLLLGSSLN